MGSFVDMTGRRYGRLLVLECAGRNPLRTPVRKVSPGLRPHGTGAAMKHHWIVMCWSYCGLKFDRITDRQIHERDCDDCKAEYRAARES